MWDGLAPEAGMVQAVHHAVPLCPSTSHLARRSSLSDARALRAWHGGSFAVRGQVHDGHDQSHACTGITAMTKPAHRPDKSDRPESPDSAGRQPSPLNVAGRPATKAAPVARPSVPEPVTGAQSLVRSLEALG